MPTNPLVDRQVPATLPLLQQGELLIVTARCTLSAPSVAALNELLSDTDRARISRLLRSIDRTRAALARIVARVTLGQWLGLRPSLVSIALTEAGKPLAPDGYAVSWSHSGDHVFVAFARGRSIGVDVEEARRLEDLAELARTAFSPNEVTHLLELPPTARQVAFFRLWVRKEALGKAIGVGLLEPERLGFNLLPDTEPITVVDPIDGRTWWTSALPCPAEAYAAVAVDVAPAAMHLRNWEALRL